MVPSGQGGAQQGAGQSLGRGKPPGRSWASPAICLSPEGSRLILGALPSQALSCPISTENFKRPLTPVALPHPAVELGCPPSFARLPFAFQGFLCLYSAWLISPPSTGGGCLSLATSPTTKGALGSQAVLPACILCPSLQNSQLLLWLASWGHLE